jgi:hypothetical protein
MKSETLSKICYGLSIKEIARDRKWRNIKSKKIIYCGEAYVDPPY